VDDEVAALVFERNEQGSRCRTQVAERCLDGHLISDSWVTVTLARQPKIYSLCVRSRVLQPWSDPVTPAVSNGPVKVL
jgi:hypothetical protein